jgi:hypothetical protein
MDVTLKVKGWLTSLTQNVSQRIGRARFVNARVDIQI